MGDEYHTARYSAEIFLNIPKTLQWVAFVRELDDLLKSFPNAISTSRVRSLGQIRLCMDVYTGNRSLLHLIVRRSAPTKLGVYLKRNSWPPHPDDYMYEKKLRDVIKRLIQTYEARSRAAQAEAEKDGGAQQ